MKNDLTVLANVLELPLELTRDRKEIGFAWLFGNVGIRRNLAADSAAKHALDGDISYELIPFSNLKPCVNKYQLELWQSELN